MLSFKITVVVIVLLIFAAFGFAAYKAEIVVARKAKEFRESQAKTNTTNKKK